MSNFIDFNNNLLPGNLVFSDLDGEVGRFFGSFWEELFPPKYFHVKDGKLHFQGNADKSVELFVQFINDCGLIPKVVNDAPVE